MTASFDIIQHFLAQPNKAENLLTLVATQAPLEQLIRHKSELPFDNDHIDFCTAIIKSHPEFFEHLPDTIKEDQAIYDAYVSLIKEKPNTFAKFPLIFKQDVFIVHTACALATNNCRHLDLSYKNNEELIIIALIATRRYLIERQNQINKEKKTSSETLTYYKQLRRRNRKKHFPALALQTTNPVFFNIQNELNICMDNAEIAKAIKEGDRNDSSYLMLGVLLFGAIALSTCILMAIVFPAGGIGLSLVLGISITFAVSTLLTITSLVVIGKSINRHVTAKIRFEESCDNAEQLIEQCNLLPNQASFFKEQDTTGNAKNSINDTHPAHFGGFKKQGS